MTEIKRPPAPPSFGLTSPSVPHKEKSPAASQKRPDSYQAPTASEVFRSASKAVLEQSTVAKSLAPSMASPKTTAASFRIPLVETFFNESYKAPGYTQTMSSLRDEAFSSGFPFLFVVKEMKDEKRGAAKFDAIPCAPFYEEVDRNDQRALEGSTQVYVLKKGSKEAYSIGSINDVESEKNPLGHHLLMLNSDQFGIDDPENVRGQTIAAASVLFELGVCVPSDKVLAEALMTHLSKDEQRYNIGRVMIDALLEEDYRCAEACLRHGGEVQSVDDHGHVAISCALRPEAYNFLQKMLNETGTSEDVPYLKSILKDASLSLDPAIRKVLTENVMRLSRPNFSV